MLGFCPLASGSKGNCVFLGTEHTKILIDAGISARAIKQKLASIDVDIADIDAIFITHDHSDHINGLRGLSYKMDIPIVTNSETAKGIAKYFKGNANFKIFATGETFEFMDLEVRPFSILHDTADPVAFAVKNENIKMGFCTDLGFVTSLVERELQQCHYLYLEANHQPSMVHACSRPMIYKQRVLGRHGHLSNENCAKLLSKIYHPHLKKVYLAHLSQECNHQKMALQVVCDEIGDKELDVKIAHQDIVSDPTFFST